MPERPQRQAPLGKLRRGGPRDTEGRCEVDCTAAPPTPLFVIVEGVANVACHPEAHQSNNHLAR
eukprot:5468540-Amphidinium_carterae.1